MPSTISNIGVIIIFLKNFQEVCGLGKIHIQANIGTHVTNNFRKYAQGGAEQKENIYC